MTKEKKMAKKVVYIDMDNTLVDFGARLEGISPEVRAAYDGRADEIPGLFAVMPPMPGAIEAYHRLVEHFDVYILSTAPWLNPSAWQHKVEWVHLHLGIAEDTPAYKRLILSHHKDLNRGDYLIDDRRHHNGADRFGGELIEFGVAPFDTWQSVADHLIARAAEPRPLADLRPRERREQIALARGIAVAAHTGQVDKLGVDYIAHPAAVAAHFDPEVRTLEHCAGWLHDVLEDTAVDADRLRLAGIHPEVVRVVELLARPKEQPMADADDYYRRIAADPAARAVKGADIAHNTLPERVARLDSDTAA